MTVFRERSTQFVLLQVVRQDFHRVAMRLEYELENTKKEAYPDLYRHNHIKTM